MNLFGFLNGSPKDTDSGCGLGSIFPMSLQESVFVRADILATYHKILSDALERVHGIPKKIEPLMFDSCVQTKANQGLITLLSSAMSYQQDLYLVYKADVLRVATSAEQEQIANDYKKQARSKVGVYISFTEYRRTTMLLIYSTFEFCILTSLNKTLNLSKAIQVKVSDMRGSVALNDSDIAKQQAKDITSALGKGQDIVIDVKDEIATATVDTGSTEKAISFLDAKRAFILGLPMSYISGVQTTGIGSTGEADMRAIERGLKGYYESILGPTLLALFGIDTEYKSEDFRQIASALEAAKTFDLISDEYISKAAKTDVLQRMFDLDPEKEKRALNKEAVSGDPIRPAQITSQSSAESDG